MSSGNSHLCCPQSSIADATTQVAEKKAALLFKETIVVVAAGKVSELCATVAKLQEAIASEQDSSHICRTNEHQPEKLREFSQEAVNCEAEGVSEHMVYFQPQEGAVTDLKRPLRENRHVTSGLLPAKTYFIKCRNRDSPEAGVAEENEKLVGLKTTISELREAVTQKEEALMISQLLKAAEDVAAKQTAEDASVERAAARKTLKDAKKLKVKAERDAVMRKEAAVMRKEAAALKAEKDATAHKAAADGVASKTAAEESAALRIEELRKKVALAEFPGETAQSIGQMIIEEREVLHSAVEKEKFKLAHECKVADALLCE